jgi:Leucine-rich repeat (LRR) protein
MFIPSLLSRMWKRRRLQENNLQRLDAQLFLKLRSLKILDMSSNQLSSSLPTELFQSIYHIKGTHSHT